MLLFFTYRGPWLCWKCVTNASLYFLSSLLSHPHSNWGPSDLAGIDRHNSREVITSHCISNHEYVWMSQSNWCVTMVCLLVCLTKHSGWSLFFLVWCVQTNKSKTLASSHAVSQILYLNPRVLCGSSCVGGPEKMGGGRFLSSSDSRKNKQWHHICRRFVQYRYV